MEFIERMNVLEKQMLTTKNSLDKQGYFCISRQKINRKLLRWLHIKTNQQLNIVHLSDEKIEPISTGLIKFNQY